MAELAKRLIGLKDKLYWRERWGIYHCFRKEDRKTEGRYFRALCSKHILLKGPGTQRCQRPAAVLRCCECDTAEMQRRGWTESGPPC